jgi:ParB family chromosome partitioning protein
VQVKQVKLENIEVGKYQLRQAVDEKVVEKLAGSIEKVGLLHPLLVQEKGEGKYDLVAGHVRLEALKKQGAKTASVAVLKEGDLPALQSALTESITRVDLKPLEKARGIRKLKELGMAEAEIAGLLGVSAAQVSNLLALFELQPEVQEAIDKGELSFGHAKALLALRSNRELQLQAFNRIKEAIGAGEKATTRYVEKLVRNLKRSGAEELRLTLPQQVSVEERARSKRLVVAFTSREELRGRVIEFLRNNFPDTKL